MADTTAGPGCRVGSEVSGNRLKQVRDTRFQRVQIRFFKRDFLINFFEQVKHGICCTFPEVYL